MDLFTIIGYRCDGSPIFAALGFQGDDDDDSDADFDDSVEDDDSDDDSDSEEDEEHEDEDEDDEDEKPPAKKTAKKIAPPKRKEGESNRDYALRRERESHKQTRRALAALRQQHESDNERLQREAQEAAEKKYKPVAIKAAATAALAEAKIRGSAARAVSLLNLDNIDVEDGEVYGLEDEIERVKDEFPELFGTDGGNSDEEKPRSKRRAPNPDAGPKRSPDKKLTSAEKLAKLAGRS